MRLSTRGKKGPKPVSAEITFSVEEFYAASLARAAHAGGIPVDRLAAQIMRSWLLARPVTPAGIAAADARLPISDDARDAARAAAVDALRNGLIELADTLPDELGTGRGQQRVDAVGRDIADAALDRAFAALVRGGIA